MAERESANVPSGPSLTSGAGSFRRRLPDALMSNLTRTCALALVLLLLVLVGVVGVQAWPSVRESGPGFLWRSEWRVNELEVPKVGNDGAVVMVDGEAQTQTLAPTFGAWPVIFGTAVSSALALLIAGPMSVGAALFIVRVAPRLKIAGIVSFLVEFLAAIPSIAYGIWGLFVLAPFIQGTLGPWARSVLSPLPGLHWLFYEKITVGGEEIERAVPISGRNMLCGSVLLAIMITPIITAVSRDVLKAVPRAQVEGSLALGATWWQSCVAMIRCGRSGLLGAVILGLARASGEAMAVTMVIGNNAQVSASLFAPAQTMASLLANEFTEAGAGLHRASLLYVALVLLVMSLTFNVVARWLVVGKGGVSHAA